MTMGVSWAASVRIDYRRRGGWVGGRVLVSYSTHYTVVPRQADDGTRRRQRRHRGARLGVLTDVKVAQHAGALARHKDVGRLHVGVHNALFMNKHQSLIEMKERER